MPVWVAGFMLAVCGYFGFQSWRGLAKGEFQDLSRYAAPVRKPDGIARFWTAWTILTAMFVITSLLAIGMLLTVGVKI